jgi:hypothetical protein
VLIIINHHQLLHINVYNELISGDDKKLMYTVGGLLVCVVTTSLSFELLFFTVIVLAKSIIYSIKLLYTV